LIEEQLIEKIELNAKTKLKTYIKGETHGIVRKLNNFLLLIQMSIFVYF